MLSICRDAAIFVGVHANYISKTINRRLDAPLNLVPPQGDLKLNDENEMEVWEKNVNDYLGRMQDQFGPGSGDRFAVEDGDAPNEFELGTDTRDETFDRQREQHIINHIEQVKQFLREGDPLKNLRSRLRDFVMPYPANGSGGVNKKSDKLITFSEDLDNGLRTPHPVPDAAYLDDPAYSSAHLSYMSLILANLIFFTILLCLKFDFSVGIWGSVITATAATVVFTSETVINIARKVVVNVSGRIQVPRGLGTSETTISPGCSRVLWKCVSDSFPFSLSY